MDTAVSIDTSYGDLRAAIRHDLRIAEKEGFPTVAKRASTLLEEMDRALSATDNVGGYVKTTIVITGKVGKV